MIYPHPVVEEKKQTPSSANSLPPPSSGARRYAIIFIAAVVVLVWLVNTLTPREVFPSDSERNEFLSSIGEPSTTRIIALVTEWCPACKQLERMLEKDDIPFARLDIEKDPKGAALFKKIATETGSNSIPKIILDRHVVSRGQLLIELHGWSQPEVLE